MRMLLISTLALLFCLYQAEADVQVFDGTDNAFAFYYGESEMVHFAEADARCRANNYESLALIKTPETQLEIHRFLTLSGVNRVWIGAINRVTNGYWQWLDGTSVSLSYQNWVTTEPPNNVFGENICAMMLFEGQWIDASCADDKFGYVCYRPYA